MNPDTHPGGIIAIRDSHPTDTPTITGTATYEGKAAGLFAVSGDLRRTSADRSGSFTADAKLDAEFDGADSTLKGTINNFALDDGGPSVNWSIALEKLQVSDGTPPTGVTATLAAGWFDSNDPGTGNDGLTVWSIAGPETDNKLVPDQDNAGGWHAKAYNAPDADADGNNRPDAVIGTFHSTYGTTHRLRGGFAAERTD